MPNHEGWRDPGRHGCQTLESTRRLLRVYEFTSVPRVNSVVNSFFSKLGADSVDSEWTRANSRVWSELREFSWKKNPQNNIIFTVNHFRDLLPFVLARAFFLSPSKPHTVTQSPSPHRRVGGVAQSLRGRPCFVGSRNTRHQATCNAAACDGPRR